MQRAWRSGPVFLLPYPQDQLICTYSTRASSTMLPRWDAGPALPQAVADKGQGQPSGCSAPSRPRWQRACVEGGEYFSLAHATTWQTEVVISSPTLMPSELTHLLLYQQGQLNCAAQVRCRTRSPECCQLTVFVSQCLGIWGWGDWGNWRCCLVFVGCVFFFLVYVVLSGS